MSDIIDKSLILKKIKEAYDFKSDTEFANFLGVKPQTISSWHRRNTFDTDLIYSKCVNINADFLLSGEGEVLKPNVKEKLYNESITNSITESITNQMYKKGYTSNEDTKTKSEENVTISNGNKNGNKPNVQKMLPFESVKNPKCKKVHTLIEEEKNAETLSNEVSLQKEVQDLRGRLQESKDHISTLKELVKDLKEQRDKWEHRYNLAQAEIRELKNVRLLGDTKAGVG